MRVPVSEIALDTNGRALDGVRFSVVDRTTGLGATLWSDATTGTTTANPIVTVNGRADAWTYPGPIRIDVSDSQNPVRFSAYTQYRELLPSQAIHARVQFAANTTIYIPNASLTAINFASEFYDTDNMWAASQPSRIYVNTPGKYLCVAGVIFAANPGATVGNRTIAIRPNGASARIAGARFAANPTSGEPTVTTASGITALSVSGYIEVNAYAVAGATIGIVHTDGGTNMQTFLEITWLGR